MAVTLDVDLGDLVRCEVEFKNAAGVLTTPTAVTWTVRKPDGTTSPYTQGSSPEATSPSTGVSRLEFLPATVGRYKVRCLGTGVVQQAAVGWVHVT